MISSQVLSDFFLQFRPPGPKSEVDLNFVLEVLSDFFLQFRPPGPKCLIPTNFDFRPPGPKWMDSQFLPPGRKRLEVGA